jgi:hypothetical protein
MNVEAIPSHPHRRTGTPVWYLGGMEANLSVWTTTFPDKSYKLNLLYQLVFLQNTLGAAAQ